MIINTSFTKEQAKESLKTLINCSDLLVAEDEIEALVPIYSKYMEYDLAVDVYAAFPAHHYDQVWDERDKWKSRLKEACRDLWLEDLYDYIVS